nr:hypothetical protein [Paenibacillus sp. VKM B-2647]
MIVTFTTVTVDGKSPVNDPPEPLLVLVLDVGAIINALPLFKTPLLELTLKRGIKEAIALNLPCCIIQTDTVLAVVSY